MLAVIARRHVLIAAVLAGAAVVGCGPTTPVPVETVRPTKQALEPVSSVAESAVAAGKTAGAVIVVGSRGEVVYRRAFGNRSVRPMRQAMTEDTVFDVASLTKVVATAPSVMHLVDQGKISLDAPVARYWPEFAANGKGGITVRQLLTHFSGLPAGLSSRTPWSGEAEALAVIAAEAPRTIPGTSFQYSDINFIALGEVVRRVSGMPLDAYAQRYIFTPLAMRDTSFRPRDRVRIAPNDVQYGSLRWGQVQDPTAYRMGGVAGNAGLFSTADDLGVFAEMMVNGGRANGVQVLSPEAVRMMTTRQSPPGNGVVRGLGWDINSPYSRDHTAYFPAGSFGHTGYTGTSMWIDPASKSYLIILANRLHPDGTGEVRGLRAGTAAIVASALGLSSGLPVSYGPDDDEWALAEPVAGEGAADGAGRVRTGIDVLAADTFAPLKGLRVGLVTNHTGRDANGRRTVDVLAGASGVRLVALYSPEHGLSGLYDQHVASGVDTATGLPVHSLYGAVKRPTPEMLQGIDALVFDIQDAGARFYTYISTLGYTMEAAARLGIPYFVLDRPNPITAAAVQGPVLDADMRSFTAYYPIPVRHGMTVGELAKMFNTEAGIGAKLTVIPMRGYSRAAWFDQTGLPWISPSPNLRSLTQTALYPGTAMVEGANVSVGRGTDAPFELVGAPWIDGDVLAAYLGGRGLTGVRISPASFTPTSSIYRGRLCRGVRFTVVDRNALDSPALGIELIAALYRLYPRDFQVGDTLGMIGSRAVLQAIRRGDDPRAIQASWQPQLAAFDRRRSAYLMY